MRAFSDRRCAATKERWSNRKPCALFTAYTMSTSTDDIAFSQNRWEQNLHALLIIHIASNKTFLDRTMILKKKGMEEAEADRRAGQMLCVAKTMGVYQFCICRGLGLDLCFLLSRMPSKNERKAGRT